MTKWKKYFESVLCNACDNNSVFVYLGGSHNQTKQIFLKRVYLQNPNKVYYHKGDIDVYGFLILENLRGKTEIPFTPLEMDIATLERFYKSGLYKELTENDKKLMRSEKLQKYSEVFGYMLEHNCKVEQESIKAVEIMADVNV